MFCNTEVLGSHRLGVVIDRIDISCLDQVLEEELLPQGDQKHTIDVVFAYTSGFVLLILFRLFSPLSHNFFGCLGYFFYSEQHPFYMSLFLPSLFHPGLHLSLHPGHLFSQGYFWGAGGFLFSSVPFLILFVQPTSISFSFSPHFPPSFLLIEEFLLPLIKH